LRPLNGKDNLRRQASFTDSDLSQLDQQFVARLKRAGVI